MMKKLVLHFDLNRTILMSDVAGGRSMENTLNYLLAECTYGRVLENEWVCVSKEPSLAPPAPSLITYKAFVDTLYPYKSMHGATNALDEVKAFNKAQKKKRTALQSAFTSGPGRPISESYDRVLSSLYFPEGSTREAAKAAAATLPACGLKEAWSEGRYYILPSFLHLLFHIEHQRASVDLKVVFRTFGEDIVEVAKEIDFLVEGRHPLFPGKALAKAMRLEPPFATFYRDGFDASGTALALNTLTKVPFNASNTTATPNEFYATASPPVTVIRGFPSIQQEVNELLSSRPVIALRDYWEWWSTHAEHAEYGKLLLVDPALPAVFFDDHIEEHEAHIVDVRNAATGTVVPFEEAKAKYLRRVEPFYAITDASYYIRHVQAIVDCL
ncbi:unnamed protein product [Aphanomyces euteiches]|uniref:Uncharacterized protein n=1 Tax=Aphanomyces euteiches TaxID=100861 RepID=A0A6G0WYV9_9STRA|nr:hypothetical protein Ae201684_010235 [Aphanomyces euteiches]KAH9075924.1 hypothetical protein Ae201684P_012415 [Aphanomyces euteiches]KAH9156452.1 hypothetical protein AeRB84_001649 [Aphanomyces euteiches]